MRNDVLFEVRNIMGKGVKINASEIARRYNCDYRTVLKYMKNIAEGKQIKKSYPKRGSKLDDFKSVINEKLDMGATATSIYDFIRLDIEGKKYTGKYTIVKNYCREYKKEQLKKATIRFETEPGYQAQCDWKEEMTLVNANGEKVVFNIFLLVLGYSRTKYLELTLDRNQDTVMKALYNGLKYFGGVPKEIVFDNMKTVVDQSRTQFQEAQYNSRFYEFSKELSFDIWSCRPYRPQTKGRVEALAKFVDYLRVYNKEFKTIEELDEIVKKFNDRINSEQSNATNEIPFERLKKEHLKPLPKAEIIDNFLMKQNITRKVQKDSMIAFNKKKYSLHPNYIGKTVELKVNNDELVIKYNGIVVSTHKITSKMINYHEEDYKEILKSDVMKFNSEIEIEEVAKKNLAIYDKLE